MRASLIVVGLGLVGCTGAQGPAGPEGSMGTMGTMGSQGAVGPYAPGAGTPGPANAVLTADGSGSAAWSTSAALTSLAVTGTGKAGFGTTTPSAKLDVVTENTDTSLQVSRFNDDSAAAVIKAVRALGTAAAPVAVATSTGLLTISAFGHDGTSPQPAGQLAFTVDGAVSAGVVPTRFSISTADSTGAMTERLRVDQFGHLIAPQQSTPTLNADCGAGATITGNDMTGAFRLSTAPGTTQCTVSFAHTFANTGFHPSCSVSEHEGLPFGAGAVDDAFRVVGTDVNQPIAGATFEYICIGHL